MTVLTFNTQPQVIDSLLLSKYNEFSGTTLLVSSRRSPGTEIGPQGLCEGRDREMERQSEAATAMEGERGRSGGDTVSDCGGGREGRRREGEVGESEGRSKDDDDEGRGREGG